MQWPNKRIWKTQKTLHRKLIIEQDEPHTNSGLAQVVRKGLVVPAPLVVPIVLLWLKIRMHSQETGKEAEL